MHTVTESFIHDNLMGPDVSLMFDELCAADLPRDPEARICDLGCGAGLSSLLAAQATQGTVYAVDSWNAPELNRTRFDAFDFGDRIEAVQADAPDLPFSPGFFDALMCLDSYNYFGREEGVIDRVASFVRPGGRILIAVPGLVRPLDDEMMEVFSASWTRDQMAFILPLDWWRTLLEKSPAVRIDSILDMGCHAKAWANWLSCDNDYARGDRAACEAGALDLMDLVGIKLTVR